jgi:thioredoxin-related protein
MNTLIKKIEIAANIAIIAIALLIGGVVVKRYLLTERHAVPDTRITAGSKVSLPDIDWAKSDQTLLLVLHKGCRFCSESAPFYRRLVQETAVRNNVQLIAVLPEEVNEGRKYLSDLDVPIDEVKQATPASLGASGTPTLILVNKAGEVTASWVGKLPAAEESEVLNQLVANRASN